MAVDMPAKHAQSPESQESSKPRQKFLKVSARSQAALAVLRTVMQPGGALPRCISFPYQAGVCKESLHSNY